MVRGKRAQLFFLRASVEHQFVSDPEADDAQQQEGGQEGVEQHKVQRVARRGARVALVYDLVALRDQAASRRRSTRLVCGQPGGAT